MQPIKKLPHTEQCGYRKIQAIDDNGPELPPAGRPWVPKRDRIAIQEAFTFGQASVEVIAARQQRPRLEVQSVLREHIIELRGDRRSLQSAIFLAKKAA